MWLAALFFIACAVGVFFPDTREGRFLRRLLIDEPAARLARMSAAKLAVQALVVGMLIATAVIVQQGEDAIVIAQMLREALAWFAAIDGLTFLELTLALWLIGASLRMRTLHQTLRSPVWRALTRAKVLFRLLYRQVRNARGASTKPAERPRRGGKSANDEEGAGTLPIGGLLGAMA